MMLVLKLERKKKKCKMSIIKQKFDEEIEFLSLYLKRKMWDDGEKRAINITLNEMRKLFYQLTKIVKDRRIEE